MNVYFKVLLTTGLVVSTVLGCLYMVHEPVQDGMFSFLSLNRPIDAEVLVIEGWLSGRMFEEAATEFIRGNYSYCLVSGKIYSSFLPAAVFRRFGVDSGVVKFTDAETRKGHNTYYMALAARQWLQSNDPGVSTINIFTDGPHGRKSWIIFKRVLGHAYSVGVLSGSTEHGNADLLWGSKRGTRALVKYGVGYVYALVWPFGRMESSISKT